MKENKSGKIGAIILDVLLIIVVALIFITSVSALITHDRGYTAFFGSAVYAAKTDSMYDKDNRPGSFGKNALVFSTILKTDEEKKAIQIGEVITFWTTSITGERDLNTHRVVWINNEGGPNQEYLTRGDNASGTDREAIRWDSVVAKYDSKIEGLGGVVLFVQSSTGFLVVIVLPSVLIFAYCVFVFATSVKKVKAERLAAEGAPELEAQRAAEREAQKEQLRKELIAEMEREKAQQNKPPKGE